LYRESQVSARRKGMSNPTEKSGVRRKREDAGRREGKEAAAENWRIKKRTHLSTRGFPALCRPFGKGGAVPPPWREKDSQ